MRQNDIRTACRCLSLPRPSVTRRVTIGVYATATKNLNRKVVKSTTVAAPTSTTTLTAGSCSRLKCQEVLLTFSSSLVYTKIATAPAPIVRTTVLELERTSHPLPCLPF